MLIVFKLTSPDLRALQLDSRIGNFQVERQPLKVLFVAVQIAVSRRVGQALTGEPPRKREIL